MYDTIWNILTPYFQIIFKQRIDDSNKTWKRQKFGPFLELYEAVEKLDDSTNSLLEELVDIQGGKSILTITVLKSKLNEVRFQTKKFKDKTGEILGFFQIYDDPLATRIFGMNRVKYTVWKEIELYLHSLPTNEDEYGKATPIIRFANSLPTEKLIGKLNFPKLNEDELSKEARRIEKEVVKKIRFVELDARNAQQLSPIISSVEKAAMVTSKIKVDLAAFIRENFPLEKIL